MKKEHVIFPNKKFCCTVRGVFSHYLKRQGKSKYTLFFLHETSKFFGLRQNILKYIEQFQPQMFLKHKLLVSTSVHLLISMRTNYPEKIRTLHGLNSFKIVIVNIAVGCTFVNTNRKHK